MKDNTHNQQGILMDQQLFSRFNIQELGLQPSPTTKKMCKRNQGKKLRLHNKIGKPHAVNATRSNEMDYPLMTNT
jgi:hypothetical protein